MQERKNCMDVKRENFKRIAENRTNKIIELISKLHNLMNPSFYEYTEEEIDLIFETIQKELNNQKELFKNNQKKRFKL